MTRFTRAKAILHLWLVQLGVAACLTSDAPGVSFTVTPSTISNTYSGFITLQASGLNPTETVVVQRYLDVNGNGLVDSTDRLILQFQVTDGQGPSVIGGATNINIPYDLNATSGSISAQLSLATEGITQRFVGESLFVLSSPSNHFTAITNTFTITAVNYPQFITGTVLSNSISVPYAVVMLSHYRGPGHGFNPLGGVVANTSGVYTIKAPPGTYQLHAFQSDVLTSGSPPVTLGLSNSISTNLFVLAVSNRISGKVVDSGNTNLGLPGILMAAISNDTYGFGSSSSNGSFSLPVNPGQWRIGGNQACFNFHGYVTYDESTNFTITSNLTGITLAYPKANVLFYGRVRDGQGNPVAGVRLEGRNGNEGGTYQGDATTDINGNYAMGLIAPGNWDVEVDLGINSTELPNYVFSLAPFTYQNSGPGTNLSPNTAVKQDFTALLGTHQISGFVLADGVTPLAGLQVQAHANNINGAAYQTETTTDTNGHYVINVPNGTWDLNLHCCSDCDSGGLPPEYQCPASQTVNIANNNATIDFEPIPAPVPPAILSFTANGAEIHISFAFPNGDSCEIQASTSVVGPWTDVGNVVGGSSPYTFVTVMTGAQKYFRIHDLSTGLYSTNTVGYLNANMGNSWNLIGNPFLGISEVQELFPAAADGTTVYKVGASGLDCSFFDEISFGWYDCATFDVSSMSLAPGEGAFFNGGQSGFQTFLGIVPEGTLSIKLSAGMSLCSSIVPQQGAISSDLGFPAEDGDILYKFNPAQQAYAVYVYYADLADWDPAEPIISVGEAFWLNLPTPREWVRQFSVSDGGSTYSVTNFAYSGGPSPLVPGSGSGTAPSITGQPQSRTNVAGSDATFTVTASGMTPLSYQWRFGTSSIQGATQNSYTVSNVQAPNAGNYSVVVSNPYGTVTSDVAVLTVVTQPVALAKITNVIATASSELTSYARLASNLMDGIFDADDVLVNSGSVWESSGIGFPNAEPDDRAPIATFDLNGFFTVGKIRLWNFPEPLVAIKRFALESSVNGITYTTEKEVTNVNQTGETAIDVVVPDARYLRFRILENWGGTIYPVGETDPVNGFYGFAGLVEVAFYGQSLVQNGSFENGVNPPVNSYRSLFAGDTSIDSWVVSSGRIDWSGTSWHPKTGLLSAQLVGDDSAISQRLGTVNGQAYEIRFALQYALATSTPVTVAVSMGGSTYQAVIPPGPSYTWYDFTTILTATSNSSTLTFRSVDGGFVGPFVDAVSVVPWTGYPIVLTEPKSQTNLIGGTVELELEAVGTAPIYYQWRFNGANIASATNSTLSLVNLQSANAGSYSVTVSNAYGVVTSASATLQINSVFLDGRVTASATVTNSTEVQIVTGYTNGAIFYTLDGSYPGIGQLYYGPFTLSNSAVLRAIGYSADYSLSAEVPRVNITVLHGPTIINQPQSQTRLSGQASAFSVLAEGEPLSYQWYLNGSAIPGATTPAFLMVNAVAGSYSVVVSNPYGSVASDPATLTVFDPVAITTQPASTNVNLNAAVTFSVTASGSPPLQYQWRLNGANMPGQTNNSLTIPNVQLTDGGTYTVVVLNEVGTVISDPAQLLVLVTSLQPGDDFENRVPLTSMSGSVSANSSLATKQPGEPNHAGKAGGKSVWYKWTAPASGLAIFHTQGSSFDTVLAIYQGTDLTSLVPVAANDDGGGNLTSYVGFNAVSGTEYSLAIDGVGGTGGYLIVSWGLQAGGPIVPVVLVGPQDIAVVRGNNATFSVTASGPNLAYEWQFNDSPIQGATNSTLIVSNVQLSAVGTYSVRVASGAISIFSGAANLEMVSQPGSVTRDKLADVAATPPGPGAPSLQAIHLPARLAFTPLSFGIPGSQDFANTHSATDLTDPAVCAVGGSSRWLVFRPSTAGLLSLDTIGTVANLPTIIAVYRGGTVADIVPANLLGCDVNSAPDGHSLIWIQVQADTAYSVLLDATNGVTGVIHLNYCLGSAPLAIAANSTSLLREGASLMLNGPTSTAAPAPSYQWYRNGAPISGATQVNYNLATASTDSAGVYSIVVSNCLGMASNVVARIKVEIPLTLNFLALHNAGKLDFHITGSATQPFMIQATTNFLNWIPLLTNPTPFAPVNFADPASGTRSNRFYRAVPWQP